MTETASADELRERMQRIATKPRKQPTVVQAKRRLRTAAQPRQRVPTVARPVTARQDARAVTQRQTRRSRWETLVAWGRWELTAVPVDRAQWLIAVVRGKPPAQAASRGQR
jgi:hypothetical protein